jgi:hypothetical protein
MKNILQALTVVSLLASSVYADDKDAPAKKDDKMKPDPKKDDKMKPDMKKDDKMKPDPKKDDKMKPADDHKMTPSK